MSRTPREPQQRKGESWADFCRRHDAWRLSPERRRLRALRRWQRMYRQEIRASIEAEKEKLRDKNGERHLERHNRVHYDEPVMRGELIRVILPANPFLPLPTPLTTALHCNEAGLRYLQARLAGEKLPPRRPPDRCMHFRPHPCFHPEGERPWVYVIWRRKFLSPPYFPSEDMHPPEWQRDYRKHFCCPEAARLFIRELHAEGQRDIRLETEAKEGEVRDYVEFMNLTMPCLEVQL